MSYIDLAYLKQYALDRSVDLIAYSDDQLQSAIVVAADFFDAYYTFHPKLDSYATLPDNIQKASAEAAIMHLDGLLLVDNASLASGSVESESKTLEGVGSKSVTYAKGSQQTFKRNTPLIDLWLRPYLSQMGNRINRVF